MEHPDPHTGRPAGKTSTTRARRSALLGILAGIALITALIAGCSPALQAGNNDAGAPAAPTNAAGEKTSEGPVPAVTMPAKQQRQPTADSDSAAETHQAKAKAPGPEAKTAGSGTGAPKGGKSPEAVAPAGKAAGPQGVVPASAPQHLIIEAAGVDVAIHPLTPTPGAMTSQSLVPPFTLEGYWLTPYGKPGQGSQNTTYITGHSWSDRQAPFDRLSTNTEVGDNITLITAEGALSYSIDSITTHNKETLKHSDIWNVVPHRLVLISCFTHDPTGKNVVVTASPA